MPIRVLLAESRPVFRSRLRTLLAWEGFEVVAETADGREALLRAEATRPEVAVLDLGLPGKNGLDTALEIMQVSSSTRTILLTQHAEEQYVLEALLAGVHREP